MLQLQSTRVTVTVAVTKSVPIKVMKYDGKWNCIRIVYINVINQCSILVEYINFINQCSILNLDQLKQWISSSIKKC